MKIYVLIFLAIYMHVSYSSYTTSLSRKYSTPYSRSDNIEGIWNSKTQWKFQWVKEWQVKKVFIPVWKKVWTPVEIKEWIPLPNIPHK